jgi:hypothetical protein
VRRSFPEFPSKKVFLGETIGWGRLGDVCRAWASGLVEDGCRTLVAARVSTL